MLVRLNGAPRALPAMFSIFPEFITGLYLLYVPCQNLSEDSKAVFPLFGRLLNPFPILSLFSIEIELV